MNKHHNINIHALNKKMHFCPAWKNDKNFFIQLLYRSRFTSNDILKISRLYIKYNHIHKANNNELTKYFQYIFQQMNIYYSTNLFNKTRNIYKIK